MHSSPEIVIWYRVTYHILPERLREKVFAPRVRKPLSEIVFIEKIGNGIKVNDAGDIEYEKAGGRAPMIYFSSSNAQKGDLQ
jgi:hypothetical protein